METFTVICVLDMTDTFHAVTLQKPKSLRAQVFEAQKFTTGT